ncbi:o-succinylbenzoate synthase, partial [bacterium]|nr:o-succinylbenzoate synthase [bacterium]
MIKIQSITLREIVLPLKETFRISSGVTTDRRILLLQLRDADGTEAWSECVAGGKPNYFPETIDTSWLTITSWLAARILSQEFEQPLAVHPTLNEDIRGHNMAKAALEMGIWALAAEKQGLALSKLLGGTREQIGTGISLGIQENPTALVEKVSSSLKQGYRKVKMKIKPGM